jgi:hypothetical protein
MVVNPIIVGDGSLRAYGRTVKYGFCGTFRFIPEEDIAPSRNFDSDLQVNDKTQPHQDRLSWSEVEDHTSCLRLDNYEHFRPCASDAALRKLAASIRIQLGVMRRR